MKGEVASDVRTGEDKRLDTPSLRDAARSHVDRLLGILRQEDKLYKQLLALSRDLQEAVLKRDVDSLSSITERTDALTEQISKLEKERLSTLEWWSSRLEMTSDLPTITDIAEMTNNPEANELGELHIRLVSRIKELNEANRRNIDLIRSTLKLINASIAYMAGFLQNDHGYGRNGHRAATAPQIRAIIDREA
ncbi:MAG: flagellar protein FlgN [Chloroflexota bacterium]